LPQANSFRLPDNFAYEPPRQVTKPGHVVSVTRSIGWLAVIASACASQSLAAQVTSETKPL
jgi:hypothetical protein